MKLLEDRILEDGQALNETVLKVDSFINHQVDWQLMEEIGKDFADHFKDFGITRIFTIESSGIAPALMTAKFMDLPLVILKKQKSKTLKDDVIQTEVTSFTKNTTYELTLSRKFIKDDDKILLIDDFLANGEAAMGASRLISQTSAELSGIGILIEKTFQRGRKRLEDAGFHVYSQARIISMGDKFVEFIPEEE